MCVCVYVRIQLIFSPPTSFTSCFVLLFTCCCCCCRRRCVYLFLPSFFPSWVFCVCTCRVSSKQKTLFYWGQENETNERTNAFFNRERTSKIAHRERQTDRYTHTNWISMLCSSLCIARSLALALARSRRCRYVRRRTKLRKAEFRGPFLRQSQPMAERDHFADGCCWYQSGGVCAFARSVGRRRWLRRMDKTT